MDKFGMVGTISKDTNTSGQSREFVSMTNSETQTGEKKHRAKQRIGGSRGG